jgi:O-antigen/teichoic acid export membrane protein/O-antigen ligase
VAAIGGTLGTRVIAMALSFGAGIITARVLGPRGRAELAVMLSVPAIFSVFGVFGLDNANARFAGRSHTTYRQLVRFSVAYSVLPGSALAALWLLAGRVWPAVMLGLTPDLALLTAALCPIALLTTLLGTAEIGRGRVMAYNLAAAIPTGCYVAGVVVLLLAGQLTVANCFLAASAGLALSAIALLALSAARVHPDGQKVAVREYGSYAFRAYLPNLAHYGMLRMDVPLIQLLAGSTAVALYSVALPVAEGLLLLPTAVALVIFPQVTSGAVNQESAQKIARVVLIGTAGLAALIALAAPTLMPAIYGTPYRGSVTVIWCMLPGLVLFSSSRTLQAYLAAADLLRPVITATALGLVINLGLLLVLTPRFGAAGAGASDSAGYLGFTMFLAAWVRRSRLRAADQTRSQPRAGRTPSHRPRWPLIEPSRFRWPILCGGAAVAAAIGAGLTSTSSAAIAGILVATAITALCVLIPNFGLYLLAIAIPLSQSSAGMMLITPRKLMALVGISLVGHLAARRIVRPRPAATAVTIGLIAYLLVSATVIGGVYSAGTKNWQFTLLVCAPLVLLPLIAEPGAVLNRILILFSFSCAVLGLVEISAASSSLATSANLTPADSAVLAISQTNTANHNAVGALLVIALAILLAQLTVSRPGLAKIAMAVAIATLVLGIAYSFSRASYFGAIAVIVVYALRRSVRGLIGLAVGIACLAPVLPAAVTARFGSILGSGGSLDADSAVRLDLWSSALRMFDAHPLFGVGYLNFAAQLPYYFRATGNYNVSYIQFPLLEYAHNTFLTVLAQTGLIGAAIVGALVVLAWRRVWHAARSGDWAGEAALLAMIGVAVCSIFGEVLLVPAILCGFMLVILATRGRDTQASA